MNENEFELDGLSYVAIDAIKDPAGRVGCDGCSLNGNNKLCIESERPECDADERIDFRHVIFVEKQQ